MVSRALFFSPQGNLFKDEELFSSPPMMKVVTNFNDLFSESPAQDTSNFLTGRSPILPYDEVSRDSGIFVSDDSNSSSPVPLSKTPVARELSFKAFFTSPDTTPKAIRFCKTKRTLFADEESFFNAPTNFENQPSSTTVTPVARRGAKRRLCVPEESDLTPIRSHKKWKADPIQVQDSIKAAFNKQKTCEKLAGDFSEGHRLPTVKGKHQDLKSISPNTVADLIDGKISLDVDYQIIDCRYPYEYQGGHIQGAVNLHTQDQINNFLEKKFSDSASKDSILILHCEFSSERGPKRARFLRSRDRQINAEYYPRLCFPEIYIMDGGYKSFYEQHSNFCTPEGYTPMLKAEHREDLKKFRSKSKSWAGGEKSRRKYNRSKLSQLQLEY